MHDIRLSDKIFKYRTIKIEHGESHFRIKEQDLIVQIAYIIYRIFRFCYVVVIFYF